MNYNSMKIGKLFRKAIAIYSNIILTTGAFITLAHIAAAQTANTDHTCGATNVHNV